MAQSVERPTLAQVMISRSVSSSPASGSVLTVQSLEPASDSVSPSLCTSPTHAPSLSLSVSLSKINKLKKIVLMFIFERERERQTDRQNTSRGGAEGDRDTELEAGSRL